MTKNRRMNKISVRLWSLDPGANEQDMITDLRVQFDIDCHRRELEEESFLRGFFKGKPKKKQFWNSFDIFEVSEKLARALKRGGFSRIFEFIIDGEYIFVSSDRTKGKSMKEAIDLFANESELRKRYRQFKYKAYSFSGKKGTEMAVEINRQQYEGEPVVVMKLKGEIPRSKLKNIMKHINKDLKVKGLQSKPGLL